MSTVLITSDNPKRGILLMLMSVFFFSLMNIAVKYLGNHINIFQIGFFRCFFALLPTAFMVMTTTGFSGMKSKRMGGHLIRATTGTISMLSLFYSFHLLPLADATALNFTGPLFLTIFSAIFVKEYVSPIQWVSLFFGFVGILIVVQPWKGGADMSLLGIGVGLVNAVFYAFSMMGVRSLGKTEASTTTVFYFMLISTLFTTVPLLWCWKAPSLFEFMMLAASGILGGIGQLFMTRAFQYAPSGVISPYGYSSIVWAISFGFLFWHEVPSLYVYIGAGIVIVSGLAVYYVKSREKGAEMIAAGISA